MDEHELLQQARDHYEDPTYASEILSDSSDVVQYDGVTYAVLRHPAGMIVAVYEQDHGDVQLVQHQDWPDALALEELEDLPPTAQAEFLWHRYDDQGNRFEAGTTPDQPSGDGELEEYDGVSYVVLRNTYRTLAVFEVSEHPYGPVRRLPLWEWPKPLAKDDRYRSTS
jgi:hypothetical protein